MTKETKAVLGGLALGGLAIFVLYQIRTNQKNAPLYHGNDPLKGTVVPVSSLPNLTTPDRGNPMTGLEQRNVQWGSWGGRH